MRLARVLAWVSVALALSCAPRGAPRTQEVVFWVSWPAEAIQPLAARFEAENPGIHVRLVSLPRESGHDSIAAAVHAGEPPDLCQLHSSRLPPFMAGNSLSDWSAGVADLRAGLRGWEMCMVGDAIYGLPWLLRTRVLYYNKDLLARAGLDSSRAPETWEELRAAATRIHRLRGGVRGYGIPSSGAGGPLETLMPFTYGRRGDTPDDRPELPPFDAPLNEIALEYLQSLRAVGVHAHEDSLEREFMDGRLGLMLATPELAGRIARSARPPRFGMALVPRPGLDSETHVSVAGGEVLVSFTSSRRKEDALKLARFLVRPENASALAMALEVVQPANLGADTTAWYRARPEQQLVFRQIETARFLPNFRDRMALEDTLQTLLEDALNGRRTAAQVVALADSFIMARPGPR